MKKKCGRILVMFIVTIIFMLCFASCAQSTQSNSHITNFENKPQKEKKKESVQTTNTNIEEAKKSADTNINNNSDSTITIDRTQDILKQVNAYLDSEKKKLNNGGY